MSLFVSCRHCEGTRRGVELPEVELKRSERTKDDLKDPRVKERMDPVDYDLNITNTTIQNLDYNYTSIYDECNGISSYQVDILMKLTITLYSIIFILGIIGNGLVIWIAGFRMKTISSVWFLHLAIADFLFCLSFPLHIARWAFLAAFVSSMELHFLSIIMFDINMSASVLFLTAMSVDRWVSVMWPFWAKIHRTQKLVRITAGIIWAMSFVCTIFFSYNILFYFGYFNNPVHSPEQIRLVIMFVIPFLIIFTSYVSIFLKIRKSNRPQRSQRPYRIITAVILCFFICWAPYHIWLITFDNFIGIINYSILDIIATGLAYLNSCINPFLYGFMGQDFRHNFLKSIPFRLEKALSELPDDPCREPEDGEPAPSAHV
ncbi:formyl peptide receptor 2-like [Engystomops pustulosus]|uniref:formyl peptide receptor 2-like n=1 Tax=Engystomops pustulosus TaxID=76066 RepID=UPI003AFAEA35